MRKILISILLLFFAQANALEFLSKHPDKPEGSTNYSALIWYADKHQNTQLTGSPGKNDTVFLFGHGDYTVILDKDITIGTLVNNSRTFAENKKLNLKRLSTHITASAEGVNILTLKNCNLKVAQEYAPTLLGGLQTISVGRAALKFIDSTAKFGGLYSLSIITTTISNTSPGGSTLTLEGKSTVEFGGILIDSFVKSNPTKVNSEFEFIERDGNIPQLIFNSDVNDIARTSIKMTINKTAKKGKYTLVDFTSKAPYTGEFADIFINGKKVSLDEVRLVGKLNAKIVKGASPTSKDKSTENDILLILEEAK